MHINTSDKAGRDWIGELPCAVTVCDLQGIVLEVNDRAAAQYAKYGGRELVGSNLLDCHPEPARAKLQQMLESGESNTYTIEKRGIRKLVHQSPWFSNGQREGIVELVFEIPSELPNFVR